MRALLLILLAVWPLHVRAQDDDWGDDDWGAASALPVVHGLMEGALANRVVEDATQPGDALMSEVRFRLELDYFIGPATFTVKGDAVADAITQGVRLDVRQALVTLQPGRALVIRAGRQVMTWGTGDLLFLNDLFPKDFVAFFIGRDDEFLKAPANAVRATFYTDAVNVDVAWLPRFTPDRYITGERLSFFDPGTGRRVGMQLLAAPFDARLPAATPGNGELALRLYRSFNGYEGALYGYTGFTKQPVAFDPARGQATFAPLGVYGASLRGGLAGGISHVEVAYFDARDDRAGDDPFQPNSQARLLVGHEREVASGLTLGVQYYLEHLIHPDTRPAAGPDAFDPGRQRHVVTSRWTYRTRRQTLTLSLFSFWSPDDGDVHLRPALQRQWSDAISFALGAHLFFGKTPTLFGQLTRNSNAYARVRYSF